MGKKDNEVVKKINKILEGHKEDCPTDLIKMSHTKWQKTVAIEFIKMYKEVLELKANQKWLKWLIVSVFGISLLGVLSQWFPIILNAFGL